jgi:inosine/xanthosine triphosphatase
VKILVGSENPVKIAAAKEAFSKYFKDVEAVGIGVKSHVPAQPVNDETFIGAKGRALQLKDMNDHEKLEADFFVGIEGGIIKIFEKWFAFGGMCIIDKEGKVGFGTSPHFELPEVMMNRLLNGIELGEIMDEILNDENTKRKGGAINFFTNGVMDRKELYVQGLIVAIVPFLHEKLYFNKDK